MDKKSQQEKTKYYEARDTHPRAAAWIKNEGLLYIHEYPTRLGIIDFLTICPRSGHISIIECKVAITSVYQVIPQIAWQKKGLRIDRIDPTLDVSEIGLSLLPVTDDVIKQFESFDAEVYDLTIDHPAIEVDRYPVTYPAFSKVYRRFYGEHFTDGYALRRKFYGRSPYLPEDDESLED